MNKTTRRECEHPLTVDLDGLAGLLSCGHTTARKIGEDACARVVMGRRVLYSVDKIRRYIDNIAE